MNIFVAAGLLGISQKQDHITSIDLSSFVASFRIDFYDYVAKFSSSAGLGPQIYL